MNLPSLNMSINKLPFVLAVYYLLVINIPLSLELLSIVQASKSESVVFLISIPIFFLAAFNLSSKSLIGRYSPSRFLFCC